MVFSEPLSVMPLVISSNRRDNKTAPECLTRLTSMEVDKGCTVNLSVIIAGFPTPRITWTLDDDKISDNNDKYILEQDETQNKYTLIIQHITRKQEGVYRCVARNCQGSCSTMGFITVREVLRRKKRNVSKKPKIETISEWTSQEEQEIDHDGDIFMRRNGHCWDWWNLEAISDNEDVFERPESPPDISEENTQSEDCDEGANSRVKRIHLRKTFVRAKSAEPESNLSRKKSTSLPDVHRGQVESKYKKLLNFWEEITAKKK